MSETTMNLEEAITVCQLDIEDTKYYMMIGWLPKSFELYLYSQGKVWIGKFSPNRLSGFSRNLHMSEESYYNSIKRCLSEQRKNYYYELKGGFFYWKRNLNDYLVTEGFMPVELDSSGESHPPDLVEVLLALNKHLKCKIKGLKSKYETVKSDYEKCLKDTEEFLNLKIDMEKALCDKFLSTLNSKKSNIKSTDSKKEKIEEEEDEISEKSRNQEPTNNSTSMFTMPEEPSSNDVLGGDHPNAMDNMVAIKQNIKVIK